MLIHRSAAVKRMLLADILRLCLLVGRCACVGGGLVCSCAGAGGGNR